MHTTDTPTQETYGDLQAAYDHFNATLFDGKLPPCLITLQRKGRCVLGYFSGGRFSHNRDEGRTTDEIAMNPMRFRDRDNIEVLQTLAHEMCHLWQHHFGKPSRSSYHNKQWAEKMKAIGLMPSSTGLPGGNTTGQRMADYPIEGGPFIIEARKLIKSEFKISWYDRAVDLARTTPAGTGSKSGDHEGSAGEDGEDAAEPQSGKRVKFTCGKCGANAWGKASLQIACVPCGVVFEANG